MTVDPLTSFAVLTEDESPLAHAWGFKPLRLNASNGRGWVERAIEVERIEVERAVDELLGTFSWRDPIFWHKVAAVVGRRPNFLRMHSAGAITEATQDNLLLRRTD